jgi:hypothetical protein
MNASTNPIDQVLRQVQLAQALNHEGLTAYPLIRDTLFAKDYLTLDEALAKKTAVVTEVSEGGSVPQLLLRNKGEQAVFLLDGEELTGAKQNRILNITILAPAMKDTVIPVSCVEAGRWSHSSPDFSAAPRAQFSASRAKRSAFVSEDICQTGQRRSNQGEVWDDISAKLNSLGSQSDTQAVESAFMDHDQQLNAYVEHLRPLENQFGAVFAVKGRITGLELFDSQDTCRALMPKIIRSYALDAIDPGLRGSAAANSPSPDSFLLQVRKAATHSAQAVGEGTDLRFDNASGVAGGALQARERIVHVVAFAVQERSHESTHESSGRVYRRRPFSAV